MPEWGGGRSVHTPQHPWWWFRCPFPFDHSFIIEQLPGRGYRVYQSFQGVYSLHGWLCPWDDVETLFEGYAPSLN